MFCQITCSFSGTNLFGSVVFDCGDVNNCGFVVFNIFGVSSTVEGFSLVLLSFFSCIDWVSILFWSISWIGCSGNYIFFE